MLDHCEVCGSIFGPDAAFIVAKHHVHDPVEAIFDRPVTADDRAEEVRRHEQGGDVIPGFAFHLAIDLALAVDHDHGVQARPAMAFLQSFHVMDNSGGHGFDATMLAIDCRVPAHSGVLEPAGFLFGGEECDILAE
ncbi:hypothetical protein AA0498_0666 [Acidomonas methanolica]|uniref:Uncharacterized protein n=1 Tax=Acidomonas methanolica NBRC 104435 TaxID=1231351 RepID=A0A023D8G5_ACIMT|nr:hypothetical protein [Acidomonas methanolica]TCS19729.1 hypothetical protein EDC31_1502 [Acidomonas methanolica]GAJ30015.1 hypothetical protein Amme_097_010 [Acidomonas methanolica NBRC 104435]GBQ48002.1 hypothetical protein AA0498_0666 [Acidomonas methanolica]GEL00636.1 hypothetical protein AME01nite_31340 [Acidomonas methanolica NBRC 104435]